jgi:4-amino-4-deoxy-L-arabinose transferase-like glycosyltransferase
VIELTDTDPATRKANTVLLSLALAYFLLEWVPGLIGSYGYYIDEMYYVACSERLAFGYVDHPPLSILLLRLLRALMGDSLPALRLVPALAGAATLLLTGLIARRLGAGTFGQILAAGTMMVASVYHVMFSFYSMNALSVLIWAVCFLILVEIERRDEPRLWLALGVVVGLGLENKHTMVLLALGLATGLILTRARRHLTSRWLWLGLGIAALLALPNLLWQLAYGFPSLEFYHSADMYKNVPTPPFAVLGQQVISMNPAALPIWLAGLVFFLVTKRGRPYRHLGWVYVVLLVLMLVAGKSRPDRICGVYTVLFAGGGVLLGDLLQGTVGRWLRPGLLGLLFLFGAVTAPLGLPLLPPRITASYAATLGIVPQIEKGEDKRSLLPQWLADRCSWEQLVDDVEAVVRALEPAERNGAILLTASYGQGAPIELLGRGRDLPPVYSRHNSYFSWGPPGDPVELAVVVGFGATGRNGELEPEDPLPQLFEEIELARVHSCDWCMPWRNQMPIWLARRQKLPFREAWPEIKYYR